jgi:hypothetical protein
MGAQYPNATVLEVPFGDHWVTITEADDCAKDVLRAFVRTGAAARPLPVCAAPAVQVRARFPRTLADLVPAVGAGLDADAGRQVRAAVLTAVDVASRRLGGNAHADINVVPGVRAGEAKMRDDANGGTTWELDGYTLVADVPVSGRLTAAADGAISGALTIAGVATPLRAHHRTARRAGSARARHRGHGHA